MSKVLIIGGGAAGLLAGISSTQQGAETIIIEKMPKVGRKLLITGKGRCNITNACTNQELIKNLPGNGKFMYSAFSKFSNNDIIQLLENNGLKTKVERGGRVFPLSDHAMDVVDTLRHIFLETGGKILTKHPVKSILLKDGKAAGVICENKEIIYGTAVVLTTGGATYPGTGSTGDGYKMAKELGHTIVPLEPSLVPLECPVDYVKHLQGLALKNVTASLVYKDKVLASEFGEMLFTHFGVSGPIILSLSKTAAKAFKAGKIPLDLSIDLKPALSMEVLDARVQRDFQDNIRKQLGNGLNKLLPKSLIPEVIDKACLTADREIDQLTKEERSRLINTLKHFTVPLTGTRPLAEAIVTAGGISLKEVDPKTFASKLVPGLFMAGEVLDVDGYTGGYNLQAAFSSGFVAGENAAAYK
ncbi:MAG: NAD(P)/FAD-dependent oxidoreductase [Acidaminococcaceae bacterium]|nr:NAD(P)/FAD-dependent oxidoreductase [Acidaminococcaceae bacterium]